MGSANTCTICWKLFQMAEAAICQNFGEWLSIKLDQLKIDQDVFGSYISSIVETDDSNEEEKSEALSGILGGILEDAVEETCHEILQKWKQISHSASDEKQVNGDAHLTESSEDKMAAIMERHAATQVTKVTKSPTDSKQKAALLARFAEVSDGDEDEDYEPDYDGGKGGGAAGGGGLDDLFFTNTNKVDVDRHEKEKREKAKLESAKKKEQDKLQREQQKQKAQDRKEKEKKRTQKQERRR
ncbi:coiled-coil domain-containing protein 43-like [Lytechinus variegatus]|uniref:coiled-coil domain-containing protein 43-like n=1 Tax=Lytechinus variegatus TaxID=7654 RepID=UPI001BB14CCB|nr:coiled-coil domain-containing protein 43-like [Lytechinus variegatus]